MTKPDNSGKKRFSVWHIALALVVVALVIRVLILDPGSRAGFVIFAVLVVVGVVIVELTRPLRQKKLPATEADYTKAQAGTKERVLAQLYVPCAGIFLGLIGGRAGRYIHQGEPVLLVIPYALVACALLVVLLLLPMFKAVVSGAVSRKAAWVWGIIFILLLAYFGHFAYFGGVFAE